jgi:hypothetical protein
MAIESVLFNLKNDKATLRVFKETNGEYKINSSITTNSNKKVTSYLTFNMQTFNEFCDWLVGDLSDTKHYYLRDMYGRKVLYFDNEFQPNHKNKGITQSFVNFDPELFNTMVTKLKEFQSSYEEEKEEENKEMCMIPEVPKYEENVRIDIVHCPKCLHIINIKECLIFEDKEITRMQCPICHGVYEIEYTKEIQPEIKKLMKEFLN